MPELKAATSEKLRELLQSSPTADLRSYEKFSIRVNWPAEKFIYTVNFATDCMVEPESPEATWRQSTTAQESASLLDGAYTCEFIEDRGWQLRLERERPTVETLYYISVEASSCRGPRLTFAGKGAVAGLAPLLRLPLPVVDGPPVSEVA